jgi:hypothetical protein
MQLGRRKPILKKLLGEAANDEASECAAPGWQRAPARVSFVSKVDQKFTFAVSGHTVEVVTDDDPEEGTRLHRELTQKQVPAGVPHKCERSEKHDGGRHEHAPPPSIADLQWLHEMFRQRRPNRQASHQAANMSRVVDSRDRRAKEQIVPGKYEQAS